MLRFAAFLLVLLGFVADAQARYCNNPNCAMCNRIFGYMPGYGPRRAPAPIQKPPVVSPPVEPVPPEMAPIFEPTPHEAIPAMLALVSPTPGETLYDLGCGDGRILIKGVETYGCKAVGIEINPKTVALAENEAEEAGVDGRILIVEGDIRDYRLDKADVIVMYLFPRLMDQIRYRIPGGTRVVSYSHDIPNADTEKKVVRIGDKEYTFYVWTVPYVY